MSWHPNGQLNAFNDLHVGCEKFKRTLVNVLESENKKKIKKNTLTIPERKPIILGFLFKF